MSIRRRELVKGLASVAALSLVDAGNPTWLLAQNQTAVRTVYVMFKCHLDVGFAAPQNDILHWYYDRYFPQAIQIAQTLKNAGGEEKYVWTTGSFLVYTYLEQASPADRKAMEQALVAGDIAWHAIPFNWETEMIDQSLIEGSLLLSKSLDDRYGKTTTGAKMTDVPGHTRSIIEPLAKNGVTFLNIGTNPASPMPMVPSLFRWRDLKHNEIVIMYFPDYGGTVAIPGSDIAVRIHVQGDNSGPDSVDGIRGVYADLRNQFPGANIVAASLSTIANAIQPYRNNLPIVSQEIGDTWIHGCASDPYKVSRYLELMRLRTEWITRGVLAPGDANDMAWIPWLTLAAEHTWGCDVKSILGDYDVQTPAQLQAALSRPNFVKIVSTWNEKRQNIVKAISLLQPSLADEANTRLLALAPSRPDAANYTIVADPGHITSEQFEIGFDPVTGAIVKLRQTRSKRDWATPTNPLGFYRYQTFNQSDYDRFFNQYLTSKPDWALKDFGKPGIDQYPLPSKLWEPQMKSLMQKHTDDGISLLVSLEMPTVDPAALALVGWPTTVAIEYYFPNHSPTIELTLQWFDKPANRFPEALWLSFMPITSDPDGWSMTKSSEPVSPLDVVVKGNRHLHSILDSVSYRANGGDRFELQTLDAPIVAPGQMCLLNFSQDEPDMSGGIHVNLFNNTWGTNYIMWYGEDTRFRFRMSFA